MFRNEKNFIWTGIIGTILGVIINLGIIAAVIYVIIHFLKKFW